MFACCVMFLFLYPGTMTGDQVIPLQEFPAKETGNSMASLCHLCLQMEPPNLFWRGLCKAEHVSTSASFDLSISSFSEDFISGCWRERCLPPPVPLLSLLALSPSHRRTVMGPEEAGGHSCPKPQLFLGLLHTGFSSSQSISISSYWRASRLLSYSAWRC